MTQCSEHFERLGLAFKCDPTVLAAQFEDAQHYALGIYRRQVVKSSVSAWSATVKKMKDRRISETHPTDVLVIVLAAFIAFMGCCTAGVEQAFMLLSVMRNRNMPVRMQRAEMVLKKDLGDDAKAWNRVIEKAQVIYTQVYGKHRQQMKHKWSSPKKLLNDLSERAFVKRRRREVGDLAKRVPKRQKVDIENHALAVGATMSGEGIAAEQKSWK